MAPALSKAATLSDAAPRHDRENRAVARVSRLRTFSTCNDSASMAHAPARRGGPTGNETYNGLRVATRLVVPLQVLGRFLLHRTTNLTDDDDT